MEDISMDAFVFDFVFEILTNVEMVYHNKLYEDSKKQAYNMVLNANVAMENLWMMTMFFVWMEPSIAMSPNFQIIDAMVQIWWTSLFK